VPVRFKPVAFCVTLTSTSGTAAPLWSVTVPLIWALSWANKGAQQHINKRQANDLIASHTPRRYSRGPRQQSFALAGTTIFAAE
jgi:hypothetical protein